MEKTEQKLTEKEQSVMDIMHSLDANMTWILSEKNKLIDAINLLSVMHQERPFNDEEWGKYTEQVLAYSNIVNMYSMAVDNFITNFMVYNKLILGVDEERNAK